MVKELKSQIKAGWVNCFKQRKAWDTNWKFCGIHNDLFFYQVIPDFLIILAVFKFGEVVTTHGANWWTIVAG